jgi:uncharacterized protein (TIGR02757 family)
LRSPVSHISYEALKDFLDAKVDQYNRPGFIANDPISIPRHFTRKEDIEIAGFLTAIISWGQRSQIIRNASQLMAWMENCPYEFIVNASPAEMKRFTYFYYRTFNGQDCLLFLRALAKLYGKGGGLEELFSKAWKDSGTMQETIGRSRLSFFDYHEPGRTGKHYADPMRGSSAKRINMFLRWMVRKDNNGVDFGLWDKIPASALRVPLDVHSGTVARKLNLLSRKQDDWKAVEELTSSLSLFDPMDPVKYDFALFSLGIFEKF